MEQHRLNRSEQTTDRVEAIWNRSNTRRCQHWQHLGIWKIYGQILGGDGVMDCKEGRFGWTEDGLLGISCETLLNFREKLDECEEEGEDNMLTSLRACLRF